MSTSVAPNPPDERFWKKYSPHHELPISGATSAALHALALTLLLTGAALAAWFRPPGDNRLPSVKPLLVLPGGGPEKGESGPGPGGLAPGVERADPAPEPPRPEPGAPAA